MSKELKVDENHILFNTQGMKYKEYPSDFKNIRKITTDILNDSPVECKNDKLLEQQISEIIKNAIKHGNRCNHNKVIRVWYDFTKRAKIIVEDQGEGFKNLEKWNAFNKKRLECFENEDFENMIHYVSYHDEYTDETDGGNSLFAALEYWNGGMIYNQKKNKVVAVRYYEKEALVR